MVIIIDKPLTDEQRRAVADTRAIFSQFKPPFGKAPSLDERASIPAAGTPADLTVRVEIAPPSSVPLPSSLLGGCPLRAAERVPVFFYTLRSETSETSTAPSPADTKVIFMIHGGGNLVGSPTHPPFVNYFAEMLRAVAVQTGNPQKCILIVPSYRLVTVPQNAYPAALQDLVAAYDYVLSKGYNPANTIVAGDSSGGNHAIVVSYLVSQTNRPLPSGIVALAPASIQVYDRMSDYAKSQAAFDIISHENADKGAAAYVGDSGIPPVYPTVSGAYISFPQSWPRTLILVGSSDQLIDATRELKKRLLEANCPVELVKYKGRPHGWWALAHIFPEEIRDSTQRIAKFLLN